MKRLKKTEKGRLGWNWNGILVGANLCSDLVPENECMEDKMLLFSYELCLLYISLQTVVMIEGKSFESKYAQPCLRGRVFLIN